jgi:RNA polymerase sigma-70 factor (ECF subfamily)
VLRVPPPRRVGPALGAFRARSPIGYDVPVGVEDLVQARLRAGDLHGAATVAIRELGPAVARYLRSMLRAETDVADAFSDWAESLWGGIGSFQGRSSFATWAFRLAFNSALDLSGRAHRKRERRLVTSEASILAEEVRTTVFTLERRRRRLDELRAELAGDDKTLLFLRVDQQLPWEDVAAVLSRESAPVDSAAVRKRFERLKEKLRKLARERGLIE